SPTARTAEPATKEAATAVSEPDFASPSAVAAPLASDPSDLSMPDSPARSPSVVPPASGDSGGNAGGNLAGPPTTAVAGQTISGESADFVGSAANGDGAGLSVNDPTAPPAVSGARSSGAAGASTLSSAPVTPGSGRPAETLVTPPNDAPKLEGPAP